jgi:hypothetical protein
MFVYDFVTLDQPFGMVVDRLTSDPGTGALADAVSATSAVLTSPSGNSRRGELEVGEARPFDGTVALPIRWTPGPGAPFDRLDGFLQVAPFDPDETHLSVSASCTEPRGGLGRRRDSRRSQRRTEAGVRTLLRELVRLIEDGA